MLERMPHLSDADVGNLSTELSANGLDIVCCSRSGGGGGGGGGARTSHLDGHNSTEGAGIGWVNNLDEADTGLAASGTGAGCASWDGGSKGVVLVDVGGTLDDTKVDESAGDEGALLGGGDVTPGAWDLLGDGQLGTSREGTGAGGV